MYCILYPEAFPHIYIILLPTPSKYEEIPHFYYLAAIYLHNILDFSC
jgi:hypothetical protein